MKRYGKAILVFLPLLALLMGVNYYADPANVLRGGYEEQVAHIMASGQNATNLRNMDDRSFIQSYVQQASQKPQTLVLGPSRGMQITKELVGDETLFNAGVTSADIRDCISIYRLFDEKFGAPQRVILTLDPWMLCADNLDGRAMTQGYLAFCAEQGFEPYQEFSSPFFSATDLEKASQIISIPYFQSSLNYLKKGMYRSRDPVPTTEFYTETDMRRADGSYCYNAPYRDVPNKAEAQKRAHDYIISKPLNIQAFTGVTPQILEQLKAFIKAMQADGVQVALLTPPFHNDYYAYMIEQTDNYVDLLATEKTVQALAQECGIQVFGAYNPEECQLVSTDFYDGFHCTDTAMKQFYPQDLFA